MSDIVESLRTAPLTHGGDDPEALEDALHLLRSAISDSEGYLVKVIIFTDAPAHRPDECPHKYDFDSEVKSLVKAGVTITFVACGVGEDELLCEHSRGSRFIWSDFQRPWLLVALDGSREIFDTPKKLTMMHC